MSMTRPVSKDCRKATPKFPIQESFLGAEFSGIARGHVKPTLFKLVFIFSISLVWHPFLAVLCSLYPKEVVDDLVTRHMANPKQA